MRPISRWLSMQWTCFIAAGSTAFVWFPRIVILPALPPASASKASMFSGSVSRKLQRASGRPVEGLYTPRTCCPVPRTVRCRLNFEASSAPQRRHAHHQEGHHTDGKRRRLGVSGGSRKTACHRASDFDRGELGFRKLSDRCERKTFEIEHPKGGSMRIRIKPTAGAALQPDSTTVSQALHRGRPRAREDHWNTRLAHRMSGLSPGRHGDRNWLIWESGT